MKIEIKILLSKVSLRSYSVSRRDRMEQSMGMVMTGRWNRTCCALSSNQLEKLEI